MTKGTSSKLQHNVLAELEWDPSVDATKIAVTTDGGVVTLTGHVSSYPDKWAAERIAKRVHGVKAIANDLEVQLPLDDKRNDTEIAKAVVDALLMNISVPTGKIKAIVA